MNAVYHQDGRYQDGHAPIGVFDSGMGGLTVLAALRKQLPHEDFIYLGDTARLPYGTKSAEAVQRYTLEAAHFMAKQGVKLMVIACNTATAHSLQTLRTTVPEMPCLGVIEPGAAAATTYLKGAQDRSATGATICVWATEGTACSGIYEIAIRQRAPDVKVVMQACNLLVTLVEEGWTEGPEADAILKRYLSHLPDDCGTLLLGCTHFPLLAPALRHLLPAGVRLIDSAEVTAASVQEFLVQTDRQGDPAHQGKTAFYVTDAPERFDRLAAGFLGENMRVNTVMVNTEI